MMEQYSKVLTPDVFTDRFLAQALQLFRTEDTDLVATCPLMWSK